MKTKITIATINTRFLITVSHQYFNKTITSDLIITIVRSIPVTMTETSHLIQSNDYYCFETDTIKVTITNTILLIPETNRYNRTNDYF